LFPLLSFITEPIPPTIFLSHPVQYPRRKHHLKPAHYIPSSTPTAHHPPPINPTDHDPPNNLLRQRRRRNLRLRRPGHMLVRQEGRAALRLLQGRGGEHRPRGPLLVPYATLPPRFPDPPRAPIHPPGLELTRPRAGARAAGECTCERAAVENGTVAGSTCACGKRSAGLCPSLRGFVVVCAVRLMLGEDACTCEKAADGGLLPTETDFTTRAS
jgi:hypothetical protein